MKNSGSGVKTLFPPFPPLHRKAHNTTHSFPPFQSCNKFDTNRFGFCCLPCQAGSREIFFPFSQIVHEGIYFRLCQMISLFLLPAAPQSGRYKKYIHFSLRPSHRGIWKEEEERNEIYIFPVIFPLLVFLRIRRHTFSRRPIFALSILLVFYPLSPLLPFPA